MSVEPPEMMTLYKRADGECWSGLYRWHTDEDVVDQDITDGEGVAVDVVVERWALVDRHTVTKGSTERFCASCGDDMTIPAPTASDVWCDGCRAEWNAIQ